MFLSNNQSLSDQIPSVNTPVPNPDQNNTLSKSIPDPVLDSLPPSSFPCKKIESPWRKNQSTLVILQKCGCGSSWCSSCGRKSVAQVMKRLQTFDWRHVREVMLSTDRGKFQDGQDCHFKVTSKRGIGEFIKNLERVDNIKIVDWLAVLEWYQDGFPHWHIFIEVEDEGKAGMIGYKVLKHHWQHGEWVTEKFIESEEHWKNITGYFFKTGYFEKGKAYQSRLPSWALDRDVKHKIKRWVSKHEIDFEAIDFPFGANIESEENLKIARMSYKGYKKESPYPSKGLQKTYKQILLGCGVKSRIVINANSWGDSFNVDINYQQIKSWYGWAYEEGKGLTIRLNDDELDVFLFRVRGFDMRKEIHTTVELKRTAASIPFWGFEDYRQRTTMRGGTERVSNPTLEENLTDCVKDSEK